MDYAEVVEGQLLNLARTEPVRLCVLHTEMPRIGVDCGAVFSNKALRIAPPRQLGASCVVAKSEECQAKTFALTCMGKSMLQETLAINARKAKPAKSSQST